MAQGDSNASDNTNSTPALDAGGVQQHQASARFSTELQMMPPVGNSVLAAGFPVGPAGDVAGDGSPASKLDKTKSVGQLMSAGVFQPVDARTAARAADAPAQPLKPGETPQVTVTYSDAAAAGGKAPDFIVKQDGTIQASGDPTAANKKDVVIQVERPPGSVANPDANQQKSIDGLVNYLYGRYSNDNPSVAQKGLQLNDQYGLISDNVSQQIAAKPTDADVSTAAARQNFAPQTQAAMSQASRFTPGSSGSMSRGDIGNFVPERAMPRLKDETQTVADVKNAIAGEFRPDKATKENANAPYETSRMDRVGATEVPAVGRYGMTYPIIRGWFAGLEGADFDFDDESIVQHMDHLAKTGKVSKAFAAKFHNKEFAHRFVSAMHQMKAGQMLSKADMKDLMPPQLQEQIAADTVAKFMQATNNDVGKTALAFHLGKAPGELTAAELADKGNKEYQQSAINFGQLAHARDTMGANGTYNYTVSEGGTLLDAKIKQAALHVANSIGGTDSQGRCAEGVQLAWAKAGFSELLGTGDGWQMHRHLDKDPRFVKVSAEEAYAAVRKGHVAIVTRHWTVDHNGQDSGHVETLMADNRGNIIGASDFHGKHNPNNARYNRDFFYLPKADVQSA